MDMRSAMDDFEKDNEDSGYSFEDYVTSDEEDVELNQKTTEFAVRDLVRYSVDRMSTQKTAELGPLLKDWLKNHEEQLKSSAQGSCRTHRGIKFGYVKGTLYSCPHCSSFTHTNKYDIDKHIFEAHSIYPYSCPVCGRGIRYQKSLHKHIKDFHSTVE